MSKQSTFVCYIDALKAFDKVNRHCLWYKLMKLGVNGKFLHAVQAMYDGSLPRVRVNNSFTDVFDVNSGVRQGCVLSPTLFSIYINDLANEIDALHCGIDIDGVMLSSLFYADDVALIAPDEQSLQRMLDCVASWCSRWRI